jgi:hypothetical protein
LRGELRRCAAHVEAVRDEHDAMNAGAAQHRRREDGVLVRVARLALHPAHGHAELTLERIAHEIRLRRAVLRRAAAHEHRQAGRFCHLRPIAYAFKRECRKRVTVVVGGVAARAAGQHDDRPGVACGRGDERCRWRQRGVERGGDDGQRKREEREQRGHRDRPSGTRPAPARQHAGQGQQREARRRQHQHLEHRFQPGQFVQHKKNSSTPDRKSTTDVERRHRRAAVPNIHVTGLPHARYKRCCNMPSPDRAAWIVGNFHLTAGRAFPAQRMDNRRLRSARPQPSSEPSGTQLHSRQW